MSNVANVIAIIGCILIVGFILRVMFIKMAYSLFSLGRKDLIRRLDEQGFSEIEVSKVQSADVSDYFQEKPINLLNYGSSPLFDVYIYKVNYTQPDGERCKAFARVEPRYFVPTDIWIKRIVVVALVFSGLGLF
jgi:hypothetical protein